MRGKTRIFYEKEKIKMEENMEMEIVKDEDSEVIDAIEYIDGVISGEHHSNDEPI